MPAKELPQKGYFKLSDDFLIFVCSNVRHGSRLWTRYDLFSGKPSGGEETTDIGFIETERPLTIDELEKRAKAIYERWRQK